MKHLIAFYTGGLKLYPGILREKSLGGSETAVISMANALSAQGHMVKIFGNVEDVAIDVETLVEYYPHELFDTISVQQTYDLLVCVRSPQLASGKINASAVWLWNHDVPSIDFMAYAEHLFQVDKCLFLSEFHKELYLNETTFMTKAGFEKIVDTTSNGVDHHLVTQVVPQLTQEREKFRFMYTSRPERGAHFLLDSIWPKIREKYPEAELYICTYDLSGMNPHPTDASMIEYVQSRITEMSDQGVYDLGTLSKAQLYTELSKTNAVLYPTAFPEISCISVMEAQACGALYISTDSFALPETSGGYGYLVDASLKATAYIDQFVEYVSKVIDKFDPLLPKRQHARDRILNRYSWDGVAKSWMQKLQDQFNDRYVCNSDAVMENLWYYSDVVALRDWAIKYNLSDWKEKAEQYIERALSDTDEYFDHGDVHTNWDKRPRFHAVVRQLTKLEGREHSLKGHWLDVASGNGDFLTFINTLEPEMTGVGIDLVKLLCDDANAFAKTNAKTSDNITFMQQSWDSLGDSSKGKYDFVFAGEIMEHVVDPAQFLQKIESCVRIGGTVCMTIPYGPWESVSLRRDPLQIGRHLHHFTIQDLKNIFGERGVSIELDMVAVSDRGDMLGNWILSWVRKEESLPFGKIDLFHKVMTMRPYQSVSVCMIVKNEAANIQRCLDSVYRYADEIVINDTGSTDKTLQIIRETYTRGIAIPKIIESKWEDNFALARNQGLAHAIGDWILWIDADEEAVEPKRIFKYLNTEMYTGFVLQQRHICLDREHDPDVPVRLFKRQDNIRFRGRLHEQPEFVNETGLDDPVVPVLILPETYVAHYGYPTEAVRRDKAFNRNTAIMLKELKESPQRIMNWIVFIREHMNQVYWECENNGGVPSQTIIDRLNEIIRLYEAHDLGNPDGLYHSHAFKVYQQALRMFSALCVPVKGCPSIPIAMQWSMQCSIGEPKETAPQSLTLKYFKNWDEHATYLAQQSANLKRRARM